MKLTSLAHYIFGFFTAVVSRISTAFSVLNAVLFVVYELDEDWKISDESFRDLREFLIGLAVGELLCLVLVLLRF